MLSGGSCPALGQSVERSLVTCVDCTFRNNAAQQGEEQGSGSGQARGGVAFLRQQCSAAFANCSFANNSARTALWAWGGVVYMVNMVDARFEGCSFIGNAATSPRQAFGGVASKGQQTRTYSGLSLMALSQSCSLA